MNRTPRAAGPAGKGVRRVRRARLQEVVADEAVAPEQEAAPVPAMDPEARAARKAKRKAEMFAKLDTDGNGTISSEEFNSREHPGFDRADADGDGVVTKEELDAMKAKMKGKRGKWHKRGDAPQPE